MILEPKHKNFTGPLQIKETVKKIFNIRRHMVTPRAFECYYFKIILNWWHSRFKRSQILVSFQIWNPASVTKCFYKKSLQKKHSKTFFIRWCNLKMMFLGCNFFFGDFDVKICVLFKIYTKFAIFWYPLWAI